MKLFDELVYLSEHSDGLRENAAIKYLSDYLKKFAATTGKKNCKFRKREFGQNLEIMPPAGTDGDFSMETDGEYRYPVYVEDLKELVKREGLGLTEEKCYYETIYIVSWE